MSIYLLILLLPSALCYIPSQSLELWHYDCAAYCQPTWLSTWNVTNIQTLHPLVTDIKVYQYTPTDNLAFIGYNPTSNLVFLVFRGTMDLSIENWISDFDFPMTSYPKCLFCSVHQGFYAAYTNLSPSTIINDLYNLHLSYPTAKVVVTGHSLGGALAALAFVDVYEKFNGLNVTVDMYTYGEPRVGNAFFANYFKTLTFASGEKWRITHFLDPVPQVPPIFFGFQHSEAEIYYNEDSTSFTQCSGSEDLQCQDGVALFALDVLDHVTYMGYNQQLQMISCNL
jgi:predicted lipase